MKLRQGRPSPALIVAAIALTFALVGTAVAADPVAKINKAKVKSIAKKQADKQLKANVAGSHVNQADTATTATNAVNATNATNATNANTIAYAMVSSSGALESPADRAKNLTDANVVNVAAPAGTYCFVDLPFVPKSAMVTGDSGFGQLDTSASVRIATPGGSALGDCPANATVRVRTFDISSAALADLSFLIWFQS